MIPKKLFELYPSFKDIYKEDLKIMKDTERHIEIVNGKWEKILKRTFKKDHPYDYYWGLYRATFHYTSSRYINWEYFYFKNTYLFN